MKKVLLTLLVLGGLSSTAFALDAPPPEDDAPMAEMGAGRGRHMMQPPEGRGGRPHFRMMQRMDTDKDGTVTKAEFNAFHDKHFDAMDQNKDGKVTKEEMEQFRPPCPFREKAEKDQKADAKK